VVRREEPLRDDDDLRVEARDEPALRDVERRVEARLVERERVLRRRVVPPLRSAAGISSLATALVSCGGSLTRKDAVRSSCLRNSRLKRGARD
jgi:hypothetical protein